HLRIASEHAKFGQPEVKLGIAPGYGGTQRLPRLVGKGVALQLILTGETIDAREAHRIGLVNKVVPAAELLPEAEKLLRGILAMGPLAVRLALEAVDQGLEMSLDEGLLLEANHFGLLAATHDMKEGLGAFLAKRAPRSERNQRCPVAVGEALRGYLARSGLGKRLGQAQVIPEWPDLVGPQIAAVASPESVSPDGTLFVRVVTSAWMNELQLMTPEI